VGGKEAADMGDIGESDGEKAAAAILLKKKKMAANA
jgi:hypothetical protein